MLPSEPITFTSGYFLSQHSYCIFIFLRTTTFFVSTCLARYMILDLLPYPPLHSLPLPSPSVLSLSFPPIPRLQHWHDVIAVYHPKRFEVRIMKFLPYGRTSPLVFVGYHPEILTGSPQAGASNKEGVGKTSHFLALNVNISKTVGDKSKVTSLTNKKLHMRFRLTPRSMTLDKF